MSRFIRSVKRVSGIFANKAYGDAFDSLAEMSSCEIDSTSAVPLARPSSEFVAAINEEASARRSDLYSFKGESRGEDFVLGDCASFARWKGIDCDKQNIAMLPRGVLDALPMVYRAAGLSGEGKSGKVLVPIPTFGYYLKQLSNEGVDYEFCSTDENFLPDPERLEDDVKRIKPAALLLPSPHNPSGAMMTEDRARDIADIANRHDVFVIADEAVNIPLSDKKHYSIAAVPGMLDRSLTLVSLSKIIGLPGIRMGFCIGHQDLVKSFAVLGGHSMRDQVAVRHSLKAIRDNAPFIEEARVGYLQNIAKIKTRMGELNEKLHKLHPEDDEAKVYVKPYIENPEAGNFYLLDFSGIRGMEYCGKRFESGLDVAKWLAKEASVGTVAGECSIMDPSKMTVRISTGVPAAEIDKMFDRISSASEKLTPSPSKSITSDPSMVRSLKGAELDLLLK